MNDLISARFDRLSVVAAVHVLPGTGEPIHRNRPSHGFAYHRDGEATYRFDTGSVLTVPADTIIYLPKHSNYVVRAAATGPDQVGTFAVNFDAADTLNLAEFKTAPRNSDYLFGAFREMEAAWRTKPAGYYELCCKLLYEVVLRLKSEAAHQDTPGRHSGVIQPAVQYIRENYAQESISIDHLASLCGVSAVYLRRIFHLTYGMSPVKYINSLKLQRAKELIDTDEYPVGTAALQSGFFNTSYFSREFRKEFGLSPTEYANQKRALLSNEKSE